MRLKLGRPDLGRYADRFDVPEATGGLSVTFLGVASLLVDDGTTAVLTDGFFSRPPLLQVGLGKVAPDRARIDAALARAGIDRLAAVAPVHTHFDHALDSAVVADLTGADLLGGGSAANVGRGHGLAADRIRVLTDGDTVTYGDLALTFVESHHCPPDRFPGAIEAPVVPPVRARAYRCGEAWSILVAHAGGRTALVQGSAGFVPGSLAGRRAEVAYLGVGQLGVQDEDYVRTYWDETVATVGAREVVLVHWDDFFRPLDRPLRALPYLGDDLDVTVRLLDELAHRDGVRVRFPTLWRREDPWS
ncbi:MULTISPECIES: MBL fold metallo-hydrolase [unclassified Nocardioides]|uniref:MBL fold metallo-hydrolase n=1 Tax=unclassified Nocardioides TaxID=2615069 RepID=UPI0030155C29